MYNAEKDSKTKANIFTSTIIAMPSEYRILLERTSIKNEIVGTTYQTSIQPLQAQIVDECRLGESFGSTCNDILNTALERFDARVVVAVQA
jgi:hypothetical protein